jgi:hypothetical protein
MRRAAIIALLLAARPALAGPASALVPPSPPASPPGGLGDAISAPAEVAGPPVPVAPPTSRRWFVIPVVSYLPETGVGFGASTGVHLHLENAPRPTSLFATALYTTERQGLLDLAVDCTLPGGAVVAARGRALHFPDRFYGIGPNTPDSAMEHFTRRSIELVSSVELPVPGVPDLRVGPRLDLRAEEITDKDPGGELAGGTVTGSSGSSSAAGGLSVTWDTRDRTFWPSRGSLVQAWYVYAPDAASRTGAFGRGVLELRHFEPLGHGRVLGLQAYAERAHGAVPFTLLPRLGNTRFLRGIREGRYRDGFDWALQSELRSPLWWRFSGVAFAAVGDVAPRPGDVRLGDAKLTGGVGLRYRLTDEGANIRLDVAASRFGVQAYVLVLEAF